MYISKADLDSFDRVKRLNIVNSLSGVKPGNLIGTQSKEGNTNLAIFSSVVHIGSNPPLLGMFCRPDADVRRDTLENIQATGFYTINHVNDAIIQKAHYTSAKFEKDVSEFEKCKLMPEWKNDFPAPFVQESKLKIALQHKESIPITLNDTLLIIGEIQHIYVEDAAIQDDGQIDLAALQTTGISGLNRYYKLTLLDEFPYARVRELPDFFTG